MARSKLNFIGASYTLRSKNLDSQRSVNIYPVKSDVEDSKSVTALEGTPGLKTFAVIPNAPIRGLHNANGRCFVAAGTGLYELLSSGTYNFLCTLKTSQGFVSMDDNGLQLCVVDGPNGYIYTLANVMEGGDTSTVTGVTQISVAAGVFSNIVSDGFYGANTVTFVDGYFVFDKPATGEYYISLLYDGTTEDPLDFASAEGSPDNIIGLIAVHRDVWLFGSQSVQVVFNSGAADFPFEPIQGVFIEYGCVAAGSIAKSANTVFWLGGDTQGQGIVWMANGYSPQRISTQAIEYALQGYGNLSGATSYTYQEEGHYFYVLNIPTANTTWVYDITTKLWHERAYFANGQFTRHKAENHVFCFGMHLVGDYQTGNIYQQSLNFYDDDGNEKRWLRNCAHISDSLQYIFYNSLQIDMETGVGLITGASQDTAPQILLRWSDDGGHHFGNEHMRDAGLIGQYKRRVIWRRLGRSRDRVFNVVGVYAGKVTLIQAILDVDAGTN